MSATDPMAEIRAAFFVECEELLEALNDGLAAMQDGGADEETVNTVFRAVHSIKGGAGAFGLDGLVRFAHGYETALDALRAGRLATDTAMLGLFFEAADVLADLTAAARDGLDPPTNREEVLRRLDALTGSDAAPQPEPAAAAFQPMALDLTDLAPADDSGREPLAAATSPPEGFRLRFTPWRGLYESGNETLHILRALGDLGDITARCDASALPPLEGLDPAEAFLRWTIELRGPAGEGAVREIFDFVDGLCDLEIVPLEGGTTDGSAAAAGTGAAGAAQALHAETSAGADTPGNLAGPEPQGQPASKPAGTGARPLAANHPRPTVRVDLERVDRLVNLVGELVINQAMLSQSIAEAGLNAITEVTSGLEEFMRLTRDVQDSVMMIRAQPVKPLFQRMSRIAREAAPLVGKEVRFLTEGETTEVDRTVIERLADPLTHMVRNAVDHGIEAPEARIAAGKAAQGSVRLSASHRGGRVVIEIADDGAGIDRARVLEKARGRGLVEREAQLSDGEIDNLLFLPGFSTAPAISDLSGRGVGMDVVRTAIQALGGRIAIASRPGEGTSFTISLPLTLAVLDGMVVQVAGQTLVVPLSAIVETLALGEADIRHVGAAARVVPVRGSFVPLIDLGTELGFRADGAASANAIVLLIAHEDGSRAAFVIDRILDQRQVVIKGLQDSYGRIPGVAAATILGDGQIALILDPVDIMATAADRVRATPPMPLAG